MTSIDVLEI